MVTGARRHDHIMSVLTELHWLPVCHWVTLKTAFLAWKCLHGEAPCYLVKLCVLVSCPRSLSVNVSQHREPCKYHGLGQLLASAVLLSMDNEHGTDYLQHFVQQNLYYARSCVSWKLTCSSTNLVLVAVMSCATVWRHCDCFSKSGAIYKYLDLLTYLNHQALNLARGLTCKWVP